jgi:hypothetical protein
MVKPFLYHSNPIKTDGKAVTIVIHKRDMVIGPRLCDIGTCWLNDSESCEFECGGCDGGVAIFSGGADGLGRVSCDINNLLSRATRGLHTMGKRREFNYMVRAAFGPS